MKTFLAEIPQNIPMDDLLELDVSIETSVRDVAGGSVMPAINGASNILETYAAILVAQMLHDGEDRAAFNKGVIQGLLIGARLPKICHERIKKGGKQP